MFAKLGIVITALLCATTARAAIQAEVDYMPMFSDTMVENAITEANLRNWQVPQARIGQKFVALRTQFATHLKTEAQKKGITLPAVAQIPHPPLHRMIMNLFARKARFLTTPAEQVAFMAKVYLDLDCVLWREEGGSGEMPDQDALENVIPRLPIKLNCSGFFKWCSFMLDIPQHGEEHVSFGEASKLGQGNSFLKVGPVMGRMAGKDKPGWHGWYKPARDPKTGWPADPATIDINPGDLVVVFIQESGTVNGKKVVYEWRWQHVEVVVKGCPATGPKEKLEWVLSIGNSGGKPHNTYIWAKKMGVKRWFETLFASPTTGDKIIGHRIVIFKPWNRFADGKFTNPEKFVLSN